MKHILKKTTTLSFCLILIGTLLSLGGWLAGGTFSYSFLPKQKTVITPKEREQLVATEKLTAFTAIEIQTEDNDIAIVPGDTFSIMYTQDTYANIAYGNLTYAVQNNRLTVTTDTTPQIFFFHFDMDFQKMPEEHTITITVPEGTRLDTLTLKNKDGDCTLQSQTLGSISINASYGEVSIEGTSIQDASIHVSDGALNLTDCQIVESNAQLDFGDCTAVQTDIDHAEFDLTNGDLTLTDCQIEKNNAKLNYGNCTITRTKTTSNSITLLDGNFSGEAYQVQKAEFSLQYGDLHLAESSVADLTANLSDGSCILQLDGQKEDYSFDLLANDGDIAVDGKKADGHYTLTGSEKRNLHITTHYGDIEIAFQSDTP